MKKLFTRQNRLPLICIAFLLLFFLLNAIRTSSLRQMEALPASSPAPALPEITSDTQPMTVDELRLRVMKTLDAAAPGCYSLDVDREAGTFTVCEWAPGFDVPALNESLHSLDRLRQWNSLTASVCELCADLQTQLDQHGHPELTAVFHIVNCDDFSQIFATAERGVLVYDVVDATPAGEEIPDPLGGQASADGGMNTYVVNISSGVFHSPGCSAAGQISGSNRATFTGARADLIAQGYTPCGSCNP